LRHSHSSEILSGGRVGREEKCESNAKRRAIKKIASMDDIKYPEHIERMLDVMVSLPKNAWGWVLLDVEKKIGTAALQRIILRACQIEMASRHSRGKGVTKRKPRSAIKAPKIITGIPRAKLMV
jgi:hypothetical protein